MSDIKIIKFINFQEIVCEFLEESEISYVIKNPRLITKSSFGERIVMSPWSITASLVKDENFTINKNSVACVYNTTTEVEELYSNVLKQNTSK